MGAPRSSPEAGASTCARVLHLDTGRTWRGGQHQVLVLHRELVARGVDSRVLALAGSPLLEACRARGLPAAELPGRRVWAALALEGLDRGPALLHAHDSRAVAIAAAARWRQRGCRVVAHRRVSYRPGAAWRPKYRAVDRWIAVSDDIARALVGAGVAAERVEVIPSAVDATAFARAEAAELDLPAGAVAVAVVGALTAQKGQAVAIAALAELRGDLPEAVLVVVGDGPDRAGLEAVAAAAGVTGSVRFLGFRDDVAGILRRCDLVVAPSVDGEGSPAAVKEAMAVGRPVVASDLPAHREVLGGAGVLVPVGNVGALARAVGDVLGDDGRRQRMVEEARQRLPRFRPEAMAAATLAVYEALFPRREAR